MEKWQLANKFSDSKVDCDSNTLLLAKKIWKFDYFFKTKKTTLLWQTNYS